MDDSARARARQSELLLLLVVVIWASNYPIAKWALGGLSSFLFNGIRFLVAVVVVGCAFFVRSRWTRVFPSDWPAFIRAGLVANVVYQIAFIIGLSMTSAGNSAVLLSTSPLWTLFLGGIIHKERVRVSVWAGMLLSLAGIAMIIIGSGKKLQLGGMDLFGDLISIAAAALWALNTNLQKPLVSRYDPMQVTFIMMSVGTAGLILAAVPSAIVTPWASLHWTYYVAAVVSGALSIGLGNLFWTAGVKYLGTGRTANFGNLIPVLAFVISYFALDEQVSVVHFVGAAVTVFGVWYARR